MDEELEQELYEGYSEIFRYYGEDMENPAPNISLFGFECGDGWFDILESLGEVLEELDASVVVRQVKEKFGGLRVYYSIEEETEDMERVMGAVRMAEEMSFRTCELCGQPGELRNDDGWYKTRCDECFEE